MALQDPQPSTHEHIEVVLKLLLLTALMASSRCRHFNLFVGANLRDGIEKRGLTKRIAKYACGVKDTSVPPPPPPTATATEALLREISLKLSCQRNPLTHWIVFMPHLATAAGRYEIPPSLSLKLAFVFILASLSL
ncbi:hypothetical protein E2542_SST24008 [Spatholobus suberectus]|nr:hypothetical protein E2542_SST24008 [Spatholobus suberectus]